MGDGSLAGRTCPNVVQGARFAVGRGGRLPINNLARTGGRGISVTTAPSVIFTDKPAQCPAMGGAKRSMTNLRFNRGAWFISFISGFGNKNTMHRPPSRRPWHSLHPSCFWKPDTPITPTLATLDNGFRSAGAEECFLLIPELGIGGANGDRLVAVVMYDTVVGLGNMSWGNIMRDLACAGSMLEWKLII